MKTISMIAALAIGNFVYCWAFGKPFDIAIERSFFQAVAISLYAWIV